MLTSYLVEQEGRLRMRQRLCEAERARLVAAVPRGPGLWTRLRARLRRGGGRPQAVRARGRARRAIASRSP
jgi:hypothetical protein